MKRARIISFTCRKDGSLKALPLHFGIPFARFLASRGNDKNSMKIASFIDDLSASRVCVQCGRCSSGCPVAFESPHTPRKVLRFLQIGRPEAAVKSPFLWFCATCQVCTVRCPRGVDVAGIMLGLRRKGYREKAKELSFYRTFLEIVEKKKRISELRLGFKMALQKLPLHPWEDAVLLFKLWRRGKIG
jgi:heterodisulfide reductase subunit C2